MNGGECRAECQRDFTSAPARVLRLRLLRAPQRAAVPWLKSPKNFPGLWKKDKNYFEMTVWCLAVDLWKKKVMWSEWPNVRNINKTKESARERSTKAAICGATLIQTMLFLAMWDMNLLTVLNFLLYLENVVVWGKINNISDFKTSLWRLPDESRVKAHFVFSQDPVIENTWTVNYQQLLLCNTLRLTKLWGFRSDSTSRHNILSV